jgi:hypothetical protein
LGSSHVVYATENRYKQTCLKEEEVKEGIAADGRIDQYWKGTW